MKNGTLGDLYHWSPAERWDSISRRGLRPRSRPIAKISDVLNGGEDRAIAWPYVCLGFSPAGAWRLSGDMAWATEIERWDLWQITLSDNHEVHVCPEFGPTLKEVRVYGPILPSSLWHVGTRSQPVGAEVQ